MKIGILGGAFDPIHKGHIYMAQKAKEELDLDRVYFVPCGNSPNKQDKSMTAYIHRYNMCCIAASKYDYMFVSDIESDTNIISYTYLTLSKLKKIHQEDTLYFIMGGDSIDYFDQWKHPEIITKCANLVVLIRDGFMGQSIQDKIDYLSKKYLCNIHLLSCDKIDISSTEVRNIISNNATCDMILEEVSTYIKENFLYEA